MPQAGTNSDLHCFQLNCQRGLARTEYRSPHIWHLKDSIEVAACPGCMRVFSQSVMHLRWQSRWPPRQLHGSIRGSSSSPAPPRQIQHVGSSASALSFASASAPSFASTASSGSASAPSFASAAAPSAAAASSPPSAPASAPSAALASVALASAPSNGAPPPPSPFGQASSVLCFTAAAGSSALCSATPSSVQESAIARA
mmetsp:Transcript_38432/g.107054  ORF Transcript_38432/g.107054 Transcript_38432/m.107054 type:complete len:200 (+) Transcript_38432:366-965(+)